MLTFYSVQFEYATVLFSLSLSLSLSPSLSYQKTGDSHTYRGLSARAQRCKVRLCSCFWCLFFLGGGGEHGRGMRLKCSDRDTLTTLFSRSWPSSPSPESQRIISLCFSLPPIVFLSPTHPCLFQPLLTLSQFPLSQYLL